MIKVSAISTPDTVWCSQSRNRASSKSFLYWNSSFPEQMPTWTAPDIAALSSTKPKTLTELLVPNAQHSIIGTACNQVKNKCKTNTTTCLVMQRDQKRDKTDKPRYLRTPWERSSHNSSAEICKPQKLADQSIEKHITIDRKSTCLRICEILSLPLVFFPWAPKTCG